MAGHGSHGSHGNTVGHSNLYNPSHCGSPMNAGSHVEYKTLWNTTYTDGLANGVTISFTHPAALNWDQWATTISDGDRITDTELKLQQIKDRINTVGQGKDTSPTWTGAPPYYTVSNPDYTTGKLDQAYNATYDDGDLIDDAQYNGMRNAIETIQQHIRGVGTGLPVVSDANVVTNEHFNNLKAAVSNLALWDGISAHTNHANTKTGHSVHNSS